MAGQPVGGPGENLAQGEDSVSWMDNERGEPGAAGESMMGVNVGGGKEQKPRLGGVHAEPADGEADGAGKVDPKLVEAEKRNRQPDREWSSGGNEAGILPKVNTSERFSSETNQTLTHDSLQEDKSMPALDADPPDSGLSDVNNEDANADSEDLSAEAKGHEAVSRAERHKRGKPIDPAYISAAFIGAAILALALTVWFGREALIDTLPGFAKFYDSIGMSSESMGSGLSIIETGKRLMRVGGVETLVVRGFVSNISDSQRPVPGLRLELFNQADEVIQDSVASTAMEKLSPGGTVEFELRMVLPQLDAAQGYRVVWDTD